MPSPRVLDLGRDAGEPSDLQQNITGLLKYFNDKKDNESIGNLLSEYQANREEAGAMEDLFLNVQKSNISPTKRLQFMQEFKAGQEVLREKEKTLNAAAKKQLESQEERARKKQNLIKAGWPDYEAESYLDAPPGVQGRKEKEHADLVARGIRKPLGENPEKAPEEVKELEQVDAIPEAEWPDISKPAAMTNAERVKWENENQKTNTKELKEAEKKKKAYRDNGLLIKSMTKTNESKKLPSGLGKMVVIDPATGDIRPSAQLAGAINPETELYVKNLKQFLKGAKDFFGARVTNFDVSSFMAQLPSLLNSEQGRRLILKQMELVNDLEAVHANELDKGIKHYGRNASYIDISKTVDDKVAKEEKSILDKIDQVVDASNFIDKMGKNPEKFKNSVLMITPEGEFKAVKKDLVDKYKGKEWIVY